MRLIFPFPNFFLILYYSRLSHAITLFNWISVNVHIHIQRTTQLNTKPEIVLLAFKPLQHNTSLKVKFVNFFNYNKWILFSRAEEKFILLISQRFPTKIHCQRQQKANVTLAQRQQHA